MIKRNIIILYVVIGLFIFNDVVSGQVYEFLDDFESYVSDQQLVCQNQTDWTTWSNLPCDSVEDPIISTNYRITGTKSVKIVQDNDLVKPFGSHTNGYWHISFWVYIPSDKSGYFNTLAVFNPPSTYDWGMECYFDLGGGGRLINVPGAPIEFSYPIGAWFPVSIIVSFINTPTQATLRVNNVLILTWDWTQNGTVTDQLAANDFFGATVNDEMYIDNYVFYEPPLTPPPPLNGPSNLILEEIYNPYPQVKLTWQDNSDDEYAFNIIRKDGPLFGPGSFESIGTSPQNISVYIDTTVVIDSTYTYAVFAYNEYGFSDTSNFATIILHPVNVISGREPLNTFYLGDNYPNPFNPTTRIKFSLTPSLFLGERVSEGQVRATLKVYDVLGNEITTLVNDELPAGEYEVEFEGIGLPSGVYFYQLRAGGPEMNSGQGIFQTKKMVYLK